MQHGNDWNWLVRPVLFPQYAKEQEIDIDDLMPKDYNALMRLCISTPKGLKETWASMKTMQEMRDDILLDRMDVAQPSFLSNNEWDACDVATQRQMTAMHLAQVAASHKFNS